MEDNDNKKDWKALIAEAKEAGYDPSKETEVRRQRDELLALKDKVTQLDSLGDVDEMKKLAELGKEYKLKNQTAEEKLAEYAAELDAIKEEKAKLMESLTNSTSKYEAHFQSEIDRELADMDDATKADILKDVEDLPKDKQLAIIKRIKPSSDKKPISTPDTGPAPRHPKPASVSDGEVEATYQTYVKDGATREKVRYCLERNISLLPYLREQKEVPRKTIS